MTPRWWDTVGATLVLAVAAAGCHGEDQERSSGHGSGPVTVAERWVSAGDPSWDVDTPALWTEGAQGRVLVTAKGTHELRVFDAATGAALDPVGRQGRGPGEFLRPNGVVTVDDFVLVVERDNHRVQVLRMPEGHSLGTFGADQLEYPYGIAVSGDSALLTVWVTDDYESGGSGIPDDLTRRLHRFLVDLTAGGEPVVVEHDVFGEAEGAGALRVVESLQVDEDGDVLFVADESRKLYAAYGFSGRFRGEPHLGAGVIEGDPEGLVLVKCEGGGGYWVVTDQQEDVSVFRVFDRDTLEFLGAFRGEFTANTDGTTFAHGPAPGFPGGVLYAVHDDQALSAFAWADVSQSLSLRADCGVLPA